MMEIGAIIGIIAPNQMAKGIVGMPVLVIFWAIPIFAKSNKTLTRIVEFTLNYKMNLMLEKGDVTIEIESTNNGL